MIKSVHPDKMAHYEQSHLHLHCLQKYLSWSTCRAERVNAILVTVLPYDMNDFILLCVDGSNN